MILIVSRRRMVIDGEGEDGDILPLDRVSETEWKFDGSIELVEDEELLRMILHLDVIDGTKYQLATIDLTRTELQLLYTQLDGEKWTKEFKTGNGGLLEISFSIAIVTAEDESHSSNHNKRMLEEFLQVMRRFPDNEPMGNAAFFKRMGIDYGKRFDKSSSQTDIDNAITSFTKALQLSSEDDADFVEYLYDVGRSHLRRYRGFGISQDLEEAITMLRRAVDITLEGDSQLPERLHDFGLSLLTLFETTGNVAQVNESIIFLEKSVQLTSEDVDQLPKRLNSLGSSYFRRFQRCGNLDDIQNAILAQKKALAVSSLAEEHTPSFLTNLATYLASRFEHRGDVIDLTESIALHRRTVNLTPDSHKNKDGRLNNLALALLALFRNNGVVSDIDEAITIQRNLTHRAASIGAKKAGRLSNLGNSYRCRFEELGQLSDIDEAISLHMQALELESDTYQSIFRILYNLSCAMVSRFGHTGDIKDIEEAITVQRRGIGLMPEYHPDYPRRLSSLGTSFLCRFEYFGELHDIEEAISVQQKGINLIPDGHPDMSGSLEGLANSFLRRFERFGDISDLEEALSIQRIAVDLIPVNHKSLPGVLIPLGNLLRSRFDQLGELAAIDEAITLLRKSVQLTPENDLNLSYALQSLSASIFVRGKQSGHLADVEEAIIKQQMAIDITPDAHTDLSGRLEDLGEFLRYRFEQWGELGDIDRAIILQSRALPLLPDEHSGRSEALTNLADSFISRFHRKKDLTDLRMGLVHYKTASMLGTGPPSMRIQSARKWASLSHSFEPSQALDAYKTAIELLPQVAWLGQTIHNRHTQLINVSNLSNEAAAEAFSAGEYNTALEWLEQGRSIIWKQLNNLRTPVDDLRKVNPDLAADVTRISTALDHAGSRGANYEKSRTLPQKISAQDKIIAHRKLASDWMLCLEKIRNIEGFENFLLPMKSSQILKSIPPFGTVVIINVNIHRCDALALRSGRDDPLHIPLESFSWSKADALRQQLNSCLSSHGARSREVRAGRLMASHSVNAKITDILACLWHCVVKPILNALEIKPSNNPPRIWWCATGPLAFLPIHASGIYDKEAISSSVISDFVISSYTPTVGSLIEKAENILVSRDVTYDGLLAICQANSLDLPPIPSTIKEIQCIKSLCLASDMNATFLEETEATVDLVLNEMEHNSWIHLACHAVQNIEDPTKSAFYLHDGQLELATIIKKSLLSANFAFLSACQTGTGDEKLSEEAIHLAAGMLTAGYRSVVATMWSISDEHAPLVAREFYSKLISMRKEGKGLDSSDAAYALQHSIKLLRESLGDSEGSFLSWVPYIHLGL
ncbi:TPR-like protein [Crucibulum laeve]|uniref:TPR-like protein n=1 Tax=Crucibulum laeve TaxID=68775 RepID=A0A5C3LXF5_9AGAR|nr:TPR-like protein [Crucibulum laeve]